MMPAFPLSAFLVSRLEVARAGILMGAARPPGGGPGLSRTCPERRERLSGGVPKAPAVEPLERDVALSARELMEDGEKLAALPGAEGRGCRARENDPATSRSSHG